MKLIAYSHYRENYGAHDWNGEGECPQHWKNKFGSEYLIAILSYQEAADLGATGIKLIVDKARLVIDHRDFGSEEWIVDWELLEDNEPTPDQATQIKYEEGYIYLPRNVIDEVKGVC